MQLRILGPFERSQHWPIYHWSCEIRSTVTSSILILTTQNVVNVKILSLGSSFTCSSRTSRGTTHAHSKCLGYGDVAPYQIEQNIYTFLFYMYDSSLVNGQIQLNRHEARSRF